MKANKYLLNLFIVTLIVSFCLVAKAETPKAEPGSPSGSIQTDQPVELTLSSKVPVAFYGFISAEFMWSDSQLSSFGTNNNGLGVAGAKPYNKNMVGFNRVVDETVEGKNNAFISATVQNTRFGFYLKPYDFGGKNFWADGRLEMDFFSTDNLSVSSMLPRIRRAYAAIGQEHWKALFGQEWDVFSPLNTATLNIGGNLWKQGNLGFRRPQIAFMYDFEVSESDGIETKVSLNLPSNSMSFDDNGNTACIPMFEGSLGYSHKMKNGKFKVYASGFYAKHKNAVAGASDVNNWGVALSLDAPFHKFFMPSGEFQYGYSGGLMLSNAEDSLRQRSIAGWGQIKSKWMSWFETNVGYGIDMVNSSQVATGWVKSNQIGFVNLNFKPVEQFVIGLEYNYMRTNYQGSGSSAANAFFSNVLFYF